MSNDTFNLTGSHNNLAGKLDHLKASQETKTFNLTDSYPRHSQAQDTNKFYRHLAEDKGAVNLADSFDLTSERIDKKKAMPRYAKIDHFKEIFLLA